MTGDDIAVLCTLGPVVAGVIALLIHVNVEAFEHKLWPRGLRWFPGTWLKGTEALYRLALRVFWPEKLPAFKGRAVLRLESLDQSWRTWLGISEDGIPQWKTLNNGRGTWEPRPVLRDRCPCGYFEECAIWCGSGHADGRCPAHDMTLTDPALEADRVEDL